MHLSKARSFLALHKIIPNLFGIDVIIFASFSQIKTSQSEKQLLLTVRIEIVTYLNPKLLQKSLCKICFDFSL